MNTQNKIPKEALLEEAQMYADGRYAFRKINNYSGASQNTFDDVAEKFPLLSNDEIHDIVFEASVAFWERSVPLENNNN